MALLTREQAKVGLWVRDPRGTISKLWEGELGLTTASYYAAEDCTLWEPKDGEWCWFWNDGTSLQIGKFSHMFGKDYAMHDEFGFDSFQHCEPFLGKLPTALAEDTDDE